jgi:curved DNA-binding protein
MDPYSTLGVPKSASCDEIKKAYRKLALELHPDRNEDPDATERFKRVSEAYSLIGDPESRQQYEAQLRRPRAAPRPPPHNPGFDDFFRTHGAAGSWDDMFGSFRQTRPYVIKVKIDFTLEELKNRSRKTYSIDGQNVDFVPPLGFRPGQVLNIRLGSGQELHATVNVLPHNDFKLRGDDLHARLDVPVEIALKGGEVQAKTLDGTVNLKIPPRTSSHSKLRARSVGLPLKDGGAGSIIYEIRVNMKKISPELLSWASSFG